jgi:carboxylesterase type B
MGESAGGGSVLHHLTAYGGRESLPFKQAIAQSGGWWPLLLPSVQENTTQQFLSYLDVGTIAEARQASSESVLQANRALAATQPAGVLTIGPAVDGVFVPSLPGLSFLSGAYAKNVTVMLGHNTNEAPAFTPPPYSGTDEDIKAFYASHYPSAPSATLNYIIDTLYPAIYDGSQPYTTPIDRSILITGDRLFTCNINYATEAYNNRTYNYEFEVPPALHGDDLAYTFFNSQEPASANPVSPGLAKKMQQYFANFITHGDPNGSGLPEFPMQSQGGTQMGFNVSENFEPHLTLQRDPTINSRCDWWQKSLYI